MTADKSVCFGSFDTEIEAARVADQEMSRMYGDAAYLNFPALSTIGRVVDSLTCQR